MADRYGQQSTSGPFLREKLLREENARLRAVLQDVDACYAVNGYLTQFVAEKISDVLAQGELPEPGDGNFHSERERMPAETGLLPGSESSSDLALCRELLEHRRMFTGEWDVRVNGALQRVIERAR